MPADFQIVRFKKGKHQFEILCKTGQLLKYREGKAKFDDVIFADDVFTNYGKGDKANNVDLKDAFGTDDVKECLKQIADKGEYHLSTAERKEKVEKKRKEIISYFHKYYTNPKTKLPHPITRLETAFDNIKYNVNPFTPADIQASDVYKLLINEVPLKKSEMSGTIVCL